MVSNQQFRLKWNNHRNTVLQEFETLLHNNSFVDCTIGADGKYLKAHKIVLSACSPYLQNVFSEHFDKHPVILLKDVSFKELKCMIDYMYCGEVNISECELPSFLRTAQSLKIKGLAEDNEYDDSASENEHQEISSLTENGRTVEPNVEIHDDEAPPIKRSAPSLIYSNFAGRKRKSPNAINSGVPPKSSSNNGADKIIAAPTSKTGGNVPSCADTDNSMDSNVCTTSKDNNVNKNDNDKKSNSQDDLQEHKNKAVVKEEPLDADDDNSSYEFVNNPCEDSDPLNEDSESNCANSGKNFNEVSIANVSSCNEAEANDEDNYDENDDNDEAVEAKIKEEELISEEVTVSADYMDENKIRVRSSEQLMPSSSAEPAAEYVPLNSQTTIYVVGGAATNDNEEEIIDQNEFSSSHVYDGRYDGGVSELATMPAGYAAIDSMTPIKTANLEHRERESNRKQKASQPRRFSSTDKHPSKVITRYIAIDKGYKKMKYYDRAKKRKTVGIGINSPETSANLKVKSGQKLQPQQSAQQQVHLAPLQQLPFRKILPAPLKTVAILPAASLLPVSSTTTSSAALEGRSNRRSTSTRSTAAAAAIAVGGTDASSTSTDLAAATYRMITVSASTPVTTLTPSAAPPKRVLRSARNLVTPSCQSVTSVAKDAEAAQQPILLSRVVLLNSSDMQSSSTQPVYTLPALDNSGSNTEAKNEEICQVAYVQAPATATTACGTAKKKKVDTMAKVVTSSESSSPSPSPSSPAIACVAAKFRKIAPHPEVGADNSRLYTPCKICFNLFTDEDELKKHMNLCSQTIFLKKNRTKKKDS